MEYSSGIKTMKKIYLEILLAIVCITLATIFTYNQLAPITSFWNGQHIWSIVLVICWGVVSFGYFHQGWMVRSAQSATHVSLMLPIAVFIVQCILFVKGIYYGDYSLVIGAVMVNSGVSFSLYQILKVRLKSKSL